MGGCSSKATSAKKVTPVSEPEAKLVLHAAALKPSPSPASHKRSPLPTVPRSPLNPMRREASKLPSVETQLVKFRSRRNSEVDGTGTPIRSRSNSVVPSLQGTPTFMSMESMAILTTQSAAFQAFLKMTPEEVEAEAKVQFRDNGMAFSCCLGI